MDFLNKFGINIKDKELLQSALMHSSYTNEKRLPKYRCNERLEFLGDAVLELVVSDYIYKNFTSKKKFSLYIF